MESQELQQRAGRLVAAGPYDARPAEVAALHAALFPARDPVCQTCRGELGPAYFAIKRWVEQQGAAPASAPFSLSPMKKTSTARFKSDSTIYTPHGLGVAYSNANLTDKAARDIIAADPDAKDLFDTLPPAATAAEEAESADQAAAAATVAQAQDLAATPPAGFDYGKLASALADEMERRQQHTGTQAATPATPPATPVTPPATPVTPPATETNTQEVTLTSQPGGQGSDGVTSATTPPASVAVTTTTDDHDHDHKDDGKQPVRLSRMNKDELVAAHTTELGSAPDAALTNDELRQAIADKRATAQH